jgi:2-succinyl-6-hydroxy-2,4-cyclohexadiene-1-carboxylate synthase
VTRLVLVPGFTQTASSWEGVMTALHPSIDAVAIDIPTRASFAATATAIGEEHGTAVYCGYSMGGRLALRLALDRPDLVQRLVLVSATPGIESAEERAARVASDEDLARSVEREGVDAFLTRWLAQPLFAGVARDAPGVADRNQLGASFVAHCLRVLGTGAMEPMWSRLGDLRVPTTIVTGARDEKFTAIGARMPGVQYVVDCGHAVPVERPEELASILNEQFG